jgi:hypothetical protein
MVKVKAAAGLNEWRKLYEAASRIKAAAPWQWMTESQIFGVQNPGDGEIGFVTVMGQLGEHFAVDAYLDAEGLYQLFRLHQDPYAAPAELLEIRQLQTSFEDRQLLMPQDLAVIKKLGLHFSGANAYPCFRNIKPGFVPWPLEAAEISFMTMILEQTLQVTLRVKADPSILKDPRQGYCLIRYIDDKDKNSLWQERILKMPPRDPFPVRIGMDASAQAAFRKMPKRNFTLEADLFPLPAPIKEKGKRPCYPYLFLMVDAQNGRVLAHEVFSPQKSVIDVWSQIPLYFVRQIEQLAAVPRQILFRSYALSHLLQPLAEAYPFKLIRSHNLDSLDAAKNAFLNYLRLTEGKS